MGLMMTIELPDFLDLTGVECIHIKRFVALDMNGI